MGRERERDREREGKRERERERGRGMEGGRERKRERERERERESMRITRRRLMVCDWNKARDTVRVNDMSESPCPVTRNYLSLATNYGTNDNGDKNVKVTVHVQCTGTCTCHIASQPILEKNISFGRNNLK